jgi:hypothetical protein
MTHQQLKTIECAYDDLLGSYQAYKMLDSNSHDWESHLLTIKEMERDFTFLDIPEDNHNHNVEGLLLQCNCGEIIENRCNQIYYTIDTKNKLPIRNSDGSLVISEKDNGGLPYCDAPNQIKKEIRRFVKTKLEEENKTK